MIYRINSDYGQRPVKLTLAADIVSGLQALNDSLLERAEEFYPEHDNARPWPLAL